MKILLLIICFILTFSCQNLEKSKEQQTLITQNNSTSQVESSVQSRTNNIINVAIVIFPGVQIIDFTGPYETFGLAGYNVYTVSYKDELFKTAMNLNVKPEYTFKNVLEPDIIVIPGGNIPHRLKKDDELAIWLNEYASTETYFLGVCNGVFALGATNLLDGAKATTNAGMINHLNMSIKDVIPVFNKRFVQHKNVITTGGLSAGIDGALHIISELETRGRAQEVANTMEYNWNPGANYTRTLLADMPLSLLLDTNPPIRKKTLVYEGNTENWLVEFEVTRDESMEAFAKQIQNNSKMYEWETTDIKTSNDSILNFDIISTNKNEGYNAKFHFKKIDENKFLMKTEISRT